MLAPDPSISFYCGANLCDVLDRFLEPRGDLFINIPAKCLGGWHVEVECLASRSFFAGIRACRGSQEPVFGSPWPRVFGAFYLFFSALLVVHQNFFCARCIFSLTCLLRDEWFAGVEVDGLGVPKFPAPAQDSVIIAVMKLLEEKIQR